jgi:hypothetical protein
VKHLALSGAALFALTLTSASGAQAAETVCSAIWSLPNGTPGGTKSAPIQGANPLCPAPSIMATVTVGTGANAGVLSTSGATWNTDLGTNLFPPTSDSGIAIGSPASTNTNLSLTFSPNVTNPYFYVSYLSANESITFANPFTLVQSNSVSQSGLTVTGLGPDTRNAGFVAQFLGSYSSINFNYNNSNTFATSFAFTTGANVPAPLPILGVGAALSQCRKLRRLSNQLHNHRVNLG